MAVYLYAGVAGSAELAKVRRDGFPCLCHARVPYWVWLLSGTRR
jgi:hypothetical protein|eukprot:COSAG01_NODE_1792_length_9219_cov_4.501644_12_plen_44_part_00